MPESQNAEWKIVISLDNGVSLREDFTTEQDANTSMNKLKGQTWLEFGGVTVNPNHIVTISKRDLRPSTE